MLRFAIAGLPASRRDPHPETAGERDWGTIKKAWVLAIAVNTGCATAPVDDAAEFERADARIRAIGDLESLKTHCRATGGVVFIGGSGGRVEPSIVDLRMARCVSRRTKSLR